MRQNVLSLQKNTTEILGAGCLCNVPAQCAVSLCTVAVQCGMWMYSVTCLVVQSMHILMNSTALSQ